MMERRVKKGWGVGGGGEGEEGVKNQPQAC